MTDQTLSVPEQKYVDHFNTLPHWNSFDALYKAQTEKAEGSETTDFSRHLGYGQYDQEDHSMSGVLYKDSEITEAVKSEPGTYDGDKPPYSQRLDIAFVSKFNPYPGYTVGNINVLYYDYSGTEEAFATLTQGAAQAQEAFKAQLKTLDSDVRKLKEMVGNHILFEEIEIDGRKYDIPVGLRHWEDYDGHYRMFDELAAATDTKGRSITDYQQKCDNHAIVRDYEKRRDKVEERAQDLIDKWAQLATPLQDLKDISTYRTGLIEEADFKVTGPDGHVYAAVINHPDFAKEQRVK